MKGRRLFFAGTVLLILLAGCTQKKTTIGKAGAGPLDDGIIKIAHFAPDQDVAQKEFSDCIRAAIREINGKNSDYKVEYQIFNAQFNTQTQIGQIETAMVQDWDIYIIFGVDSEGLAPVIKQVHDSGRLVIDICDIGRPEDVDIVFYGANEPLYADRRDEFLDKYLADNPGTHLYTGIIYGNLTQLPQLPRGDRMKDYAAAHPDRVTILDSQTGEWYADKAMNITEDWLQAYPNMNYICSGNDQMTTGVVQALKTGGVLDNFLITSVDCTDEALEMIRRNELGCTIGVDNYDYAIELVDVSVRLASGEKFNKQYYMTNIRLITKENVEEYVKYKAELKTKLNF
jgi:ribose transport system substrate-binding protein